jgi:predicted membrane protein
MEKYNCKGVRHHKNRKNRIGVIFLIIGLVLLCKNLNFIPGAISPFFFSWQMMLIGIGFLLFILNRRNVGALIMIAVGGLFLWNRIMPLSPVQWEMAWPGIFILLGLILIFGYLAKPSKEQEQTKPKQKKSRYDDVEFDIDKIEPIDS